MAIYDLKKESLYFRFGGRVLFREPEAILGFSANYIDMIVCGSQVSFHLRTGINERINQPRIMVYLNDEKYKEIALERENQDINIVFPESAKEEVRVRILKLTEAAMSFVAVSNINTDGELKIFEASEDNRTKVQFIGDSITCGYGVLASPEAEYDLNDEDVTYSYAGVLTDMLNLNSQWVSASGYGMFVDYTGDPENVVPKLYDYKNWFYDKEERVNHREFDPDIIIINLGTNDSGHLGNENILRGFMAKYEAFLYRLRLAHENAKIVCVLGTLAPGVFKYVQQVIDKVKMQGFKDIYGLELPEHNIALDGMACWHPSKMTHKKDAERIAEFLKKEGIVK